MKLNALWGRLQRTPDLRVAASELGAQSRQGAAPATQHTQAFKPTEPNQQGAAPAAQSSQGLKPADTPAEPGQGRALLKTDSNPILKLDVQQLMRSRDAVAQSQQKVDQLIQRLNTDRISTVSRFAEIRADGRPAEKAALVRVFKSLDVQIKKQEQFLADLLSWHRLLDNLVVTHEFAVFRQQVKTGALSGFALSDLRGLLDEASAREQEERIHLTGILQEQEINDEEAALQTQAGLAEAEHALNQLSEQEYQALITAKMKPLEELAERVERSLNEVPAPMHAPSEANKR